jgi:hypothetical protein
MLEFNSYHGTDNSKATWRDGGNFTGRVSFGKEKLCGIELETEHPNIARRDLLARVDVEVNQEGNSPYYFIAESDGSLNYYYGTEFISNPIPYRVILSEDSVARKLVRVLSSVVSLGPSDTVGLHVNLNADAYTKEQVKAICWFFNISRQLGTAVGGRSDGFGRYHIHHMDLIPQNKYSAAWRSWTGTRIEVRLNRSPITEDVLERRLLYVISGADFAAEKCKYLRTLNDTVNSLEEIRTALYNSYVTWLKDQNDPMCNELCSWIQNQFISFNSSRFSGFYAGEQGFWQERVVASRGTAKYEALREIKSMLSDLVDAPAELITAFPYGRDVSAIDLFEDRAA